MEVWLLWNRSPEAQIEDNVREWIIRKVSQHTRIIQDHIEVLCL